MKRTVSVLMAALFIVMALAGCGAGGAKITHGAWDGNTFTNESTGVKLTAGDGWTVATDEELAELMNVTVDEVTDGESNVFTDAVLKAQNIYDAMITNTDNSNVIVLYENLTISGSTKMTEEEYLNVVKEGLPAQLGGATCTFNEIADKKIGDNTWKVLSLSLDGTEVEQAYLVRKLDNYMIAIIATSTGTVSVDEMIDSVVG